MSKKLNSLELALSETIALLPVLKPAGRATLCVGLIQDHGPALLSALADQRRLREAPVVMVGESSRYCASVAGTGIKNGQRVAIVLLDQEGE